MIAPGNPIGEVVGPRLNISGTCIAFKQENGTISDHLADL